MSNLSLRQSQALPGQPSQDAAPSTSWAPAQRAACTLRLPGSRYRQLPGSCWSPAPAASAPVGSCPGCTAVWMRPCEHRHSSPVSITHGNCQNGSRIRLTSILQSENGRSDKTEEALATQVFKAMQVLTFVLATGICNVTILNTKGPFVNHSTWVSGRTCTST